MESSLVSTEPLLFSTPYLYGLIVTIVLGSIQFGYAIGQLLYWNLTSSFAHIKELAYIFLLFFAIFGAFSAGSLLQRGRRPLFFIADIIILVLCLLEFSLGTLSTIVIIICKSMQGFTVGIFSGIVPLYLHEISPLNYSGMIGTCHQISITFLTIKKYLIKKKKFQLIPPQHTPIFYITFGLFVAYLVGYLSNEISDDIQIRILCIFPFCIAVVQIALQKFIFVFESPKFLMQKGRLSECEEVLSSIYNSYENIYKALQNLKRQQNTPHVSFRTLFSKIYVYQLLVGCGLTSIQILSGINLINSWGNKLFSRFDKEHKIGALINGGFNFAGSIFCAFFIDRFGRRKMLFFGSILCTILLCLIQIFIWANNAVGGTTNIIEIIMIGLLVLFVGVHGSSLGPIIWIYYTEILPERGVGIVTALHWILSLFTTSFHNLQNFEYYTFAIFAIFSACGIFFVYKHVPETTGLSERKIKYLFTPVRFASPITSPVLSPRHTEHQFIFVE